MKAATGYAKQHQSQGYSGRRIQSAGLLPNTVNAPRCSV